MNIDKIAELVKEKLMNMANQKISVEVSARYAYLSENAKDILFGKNYEFTVIKELATAGEFLCEEKIRLIGTKGIKEASIVIGGKRDRSTVEISASDAKALGIEAVLKDAFETSATPGIVVTYEDKVLKLREGLVITNYYLALSQESAKALNLEKENSVKIKINSKRPIILDDVKLVVDDRFNMTLHIDEDTANACLLDEEAYGDLYV